jgi:Domain of unknown function (DUF5615)
MLLDADEDFAFPAVEELRVRGHDVLTAQEDGQAAMPDAVILARAFALGRVILTHNRRHYVRLHRRGAEHVGILTASQDPDHLALANRIDGKLASLSAGRWCYRVNRRP